MPSPFWCTVSEINDALELIRSQERLLLLVDGIHEGAQEDNREEILELRERIAILKESVMGQGSTVTTEVSRNDEGRLGDSPARASRIT